MRGPAPAAARGLETLVDQEGRGFDGYGIGGALEKQNRQRSSAGASMSCPRKSRVICWASVNPTTCSRRLPPRRHIRLCFAVSCCA